MRHLDLARMVGGARWIAAFGLLSACIDVRIVGEYASTEASGHGSASEGHEPTSGEAETTRASAEAESGAGGTSTGGVTSSGPGTKIADTRNAGSTGSTGDGTVTGGSASASSSVGTTGPEPLCGPPGHTVCEHLGEPKHALGLDCADNPTDSIKLARATLASPDASAWRIVRELGRSEGPVRFTASEGTLQLALSTSVLPAVVDGVLDLSGWGDDGGAVDNLNPDGVDLPDPIWPFSGSGSGGTTPFVGCDGRGDCSETLARQWAKGGQASDLVWFQLEVVVPPGVYGWAVDLVWFSREFPTRVGAPHNDTFVVWSNSRAYTGNLGFWDGEALTATGLAELITTKGSMGKDTQLVATGFGGDTGRPCDLGWKSFVRCPVGGASPRLRVDGPAEPGESLVVTFALFEQGTPDLDTLVLLDNWRFTCGCAPATTCGARLAAP